jgi:hypothetical protein
MPNGHANPTDRAVVVGIDRYPSLEALGGPENDATAFAAWLTEPGGGGLDPTRVTRIVSSDFPNGAAEPTTVAIDTAFESIITDFDNTGAGGRRLYIFLAGHGFAPSVAEAALLMANAAAGRFGHYIPGRLYCDWFRTAAFFEEVVLLMDCCRDVRTTVPPRMPPWDPRAGVTPSKLFLGFATEMGRASRERPSKDDGNRVRGRFTEAVIAGLRRAADAQGRVTSETLRDFVFNLLTQEADANDETELNRQEPKFPSTDRIVFTTITVPYTLVATFAAGAAVPELVSGDLSTVLAPDAVDATSARWRLKPGLYLLRRGADQQIVPLLGAGGEERVAF